MNTMSDRQLFDYFMHRPPVRLVDLEPVERAAFRSLLFAWSLSVGEREALAYRYEPAAARVSQQWSRMWATRMYYGSAAVLVTIMAALGIHSALAR